MNFVTGKFFLYVNVITVWIWLASAKEMHWLRLSFSLKSISFFKELAPVFVY